MPYMTDLKPALIRFGLGPYLEEVPGWETRGSSSFAPACSIGHHTAGPLSGDRPSLDICVNGRADLPGPLCNDFLSRSKVILVAAGRANHAGTGGFRGLVGNSAAFGNEAESTGVPRPDGSPDWSEFQRWAFPRVHAAHLWVLRRDASWYAAHRDWTDRKIDPTAIETVALRREIAPLLAAGGSTPAPAPPRLEDDMIAISTADTKRVYILDGFDLWHTGSGELAEAVGQIRTVTMNQRQVDVLAADVARRYRDHLARVANATSGQQVDLNKLTADLLAGLAPVLADKVEGASVEDVKAAIREVFADAATDGS